MAQTKTNEINFESLSEHELLQEKNLTDLFKKTSGEKTQLYFCYREQAKKFKITKEFDKYYKRIGEKIASSKIDRESFCEFGNDKYENICTGEWKANTHGIYKQIANYETGEVDLVEASRMMIVPAETYRNMDTGIEKVNLNYHKYDNWQSLICEKITISNISKIVELSNLGIDVNSLNSKDLISYLYDCLTLNDTDTIPHYESISRMGWVGKKFMPYNADLKFDGSSEHKHLYKSICKKGSFEDWVTYIKPLRKNLYFRLQMAASFASVLIDKVNALPFVFHLWGGTGSGKTVGLMCAMSVWGNPKMGQLTRTMNMTQNSMMSTAAFLHHLPFAGDELQTIKSRYDNYDQLIMKVTEGVERGRMTFSTVNEVKTWNCSFLFTGEEPCTKSDSGGGTKNRVIEVECIDKVVESGNQVVTFINDNYGTAGEVFINIIKDMELITQYESIFKEIILETETTEKQAMSMACMLLADKIVTEYIFKDEQLKLNTVNGFLFSEKEVDISERAYSFVTGLVARNISKFEERTSDRWGMHLNAGYILINKQVICEELSSHGFEFDAIKRKWELKGYIQKNSQDKYFHARKVNNVTTTFVKLRVSNECDDEHIQSNCDL